MRPTPGSDEGEGPTFCAPASSPLVTLVEPGVYSLGFVRADVRDVWNRSVVFATFRIALGPHAGKGICRFYNRPSPKGRLERGFFVEPTLFVDVDPDATIAQEEIFGPVLAVIPFDDDDDLVRIANPSRYGLSGAVQSGSLERSLAVARRIRTGTLGVNGGMWFAPDSPFGGDRQSGVGRQHGLEGFEEYLETKTIGLPA